MAKKTNLDQEFVQIVKKNSNEEFEDGNCKQQAMEFGNSTGSNDKDEIIQS